MNKKEELSYTQKVKYLKSYFWIIQDLLDELIRKDDSYIKASQISGMPKSQVIRTIDDIIIEKQVRQDKIIKSVEKLYNKKKSIESMIEQVDDPQQRYILKNKYLFFKTYEDIAINLGMSSKQISRWHSDAINNIELPQK